MLLFGLLLVNVNYIQVVQADALHNDAGQRRALLRGVRPRARPDPGRRQAGRRVSVATDDRLKYLRTYPRGTALRATSPASTRWSTAPPASRPAENDLLVRHRRQPVRPPRSSTCSPASQPQGGSVELTLNPEAQQAAYDGAGAAARAPSSRSTRRPARSSRWSARPSYDPNLLAGHDPRAVRANYEQAEHADPDQPMLNRAIARRPTRRARRSSWSPPPPRCESGEYTPDTRGPRPGRARPAADDRRRCPTRTAGACAPGDTTTLTDALRISCNTAFGDARPRPRRRRAARRRPRSSASAQAFADPDARRRQPLPGRTSTPPQTAQSAIGQFDVRATPLQMAMVAAAIANHGVLMSAVPGAGRSAAPT